MNNRGKPVSKKVPLLTELRTKKEVYLMILPFSLFFIVFVVAPVLFSVVMSFTDYNVIQSPGFVGLDNYIEGAAEYLCHGCNRGAGGLYAFLYHGLDAL